MAATILPMGAPNRKVVPKPAMGPSKPGAGASVAPKKNTRDYGKQPAAPASPSPDPFGVTAGSSRLGGL